MTTNESPLQNLIQQIKLLDDNITQILQEEGSENVIKNYVTPILLALANSVDQAFQALNSVSQTASVALVTAEKTLASEVLENVADITNELSEALTDLLTTLSPKMDANDLAKAQKVEHLLSELYEQTESWLSDDEDDDDEEDGEEDSEESGDDEEPSTEGSN
jgi:hypothetical protein